MVGGIHEAVWRRVWDGEGAVTWEVGHEQLGRTGKCRAAIDAEEAVWLVVCEGLGAHTELGYGSFVEYVSATVGWDAHSAMERIRVARALVRLPRVFERLAEGALSWSAVREITRVATPETEEAWVEACAAMRVRDVEQLVSGRTLGDVPTSPVDEGARRHVVRFEVSATTLALLRQAQDEQRRRTGGSVDDDALVAELARVFLGGSEAARGAGAQVMVTLCPRCQAGTVDAGSEVVPLTAAELERHCCDARVVPAHRTEAVRGSHAGSVTPGSHAASADASSAEATSPVVSAEPLSHAGAVAGSPASGPDARRGARVQPSTVVLAEVRRRAGLRNSTELPRTVRAAVIRRHHGRCAVPGCSNTAWLDLHHADPRSEGGSHDPERLVPICEAHHRAVHEGRLVVDGTYSGGFGFAHADGTPYGAGAVPDAGVSARATAAHSILRNLGFKESEARSVVDGIRERLGEPMSKEEVARVALRAAADLPSVRRASCVREEVAVYRMSSAA